MQFLFTMLYAIVTPRRKTKQLKLFLGVLLFEIIVRSFYKDPKTDQQQVVTDRECSSQPIREHRTFI